MRTLTALLMTAILGAGCAASGTSGEANGCASHVAAADAIAARYQEPVLGALPKDANLDNGGYDERRRVLARYRDDQDTARAQWLAIAGIISENPECFSPGMVADVETGLARLGDR